MRHDRSIERQTLIDNFVVGTLGTGPSPPEPCAAVTNVLSLVLERYCMVATSSFSYTAITVSICTVGGVDG